MTIKDLYQQRSGKWHTMTITYITVGPAMPTKPDQQELDAQKQLIYFMDESGATAEMTVYVPDNAVHLEFIPEHLTGQRAVFDIKHKDNHLTGVLTSKVPDEIKSTAPDWEKIAEGKCRHGIIVACIAKYGIFEISNDPLLVEQIKKVAKFSHKGEI